MVMKELSVYQGCKDFKNLLQSNYYLNNMAISIAQKKYVIYNVLTMYRGTHFEPKIDTKEYEEGKGLNTYPPILEKM